jgi:nucleoid-associated protein YgaU
MRTIFIIIGVLFLGLPIYAQEERLTEEQAIQLIRQYKEREESALSKIKEEEAKIKELKEEIAKLDERISSLQAEITRAEHSLIEKKETEPRYITYIVKPGDWLAKLAEYPEVYGHGYYALWRLIYDANRELIRNPNLIYPGWELKVPVLTEEEKASRNAEILGKLRK